MTRALNDHSYPLIIKKNDPLKITGDSFFRFHVNGGEIEEKMEQISKNDDGNI